MVLIFGKAMHETMQSLVLATLLGSPLRGRSHITSAAGGGRGDKPKADNCLRGGAAFLPLLLLEFES